MGFLSFRKRPGDEAAEANPIRQVTDPSELFDAIGEGPAVIYKHSNRCGTCFRALKEVRKFAAKRPDVPVFMIDVVRDRPVSNQVSQHFEVIHQSPQALVIQDGGSVWDASHLNVTAGGLESAIV